VGDQPTQMGALLKGSQQLRNSEVIEAIALVARFAAGRCDHLLKVLAAQFVPIVAVRESILQHPVHPLFKQRRTAVPVEGMLKHQDIVVEQEALFLRHVDEEVWVDFVEVSQ